MVFSFRGLDLFNVFFLQDTKIMSEGYINQGVLLWPKLRNTVLFLVVLILVSIPIAVGITGYFTAQRTKKETVRECADLIKNSSSLQDKAGYKAVDEGLKLLSERHRLEIVRIKNDKSKEDMIANLTHDVRTPLTSIIGYLQILKSEAEIEQLKSGEHLGIVLEKAKYLERLLEDLFYIAKYDYDNTKKTKESLDLFLFLDQIREEFHPQLIQREMTIEVKGYEGVEVTINGEEFAKAINNIIKNALCYGDEKTTISIGITTIQKDLILQIENAAADLSEDDLALLFTRFYRSDQSRNSQSGGSGLGLAIAKSVVETMGGNITASSDEGVFSITLYLPQVVTHKAEMS